MISELMMMSQEEQVEHLQRWWHQHGKRFLLALFVLMVVSLGFQWWQQQRELARQAASNEYLDLLEAVVEASWDRAEILAHSLMDRRSDTPYADLAGLILAKRALDDGLDADAEQHLQWVAQHARQPSVARVARWRWARLYLEQQRFESAWDVLQQAGDVGAFEPLFDELRGDILWHQERFFESQGYYEKAIPHLPYDLQALVQQKLNRVLKEVAVL